jgi:hypothetical protein
LKEPAGFGYFKNLKRGDGFHEGIRSFIGWFLMFLLKAFVNIFCQVPGDHRAHLASSSKICKDLFTDERKPKVNAHTFGEEL